jgi:hypothetical protein
MLVLDLININIPMYIFRGVAIGDDVNAYRKTTTLVHNIGYRANAPYNTKGTVAMNRLTLMSCSAKTR